MSVSVVHFLSLDTKTLPSLIISMVKLQHSETQEMSTTRHISLKTQTQTLQSSLERSQVECKTTSNETSGACLIHQMAYKISNSLVVLSDLRQRCLNISSASSAFLSQLETCCRHFESDLTQQPSSALIEPLHMSDAVGIRNTPLASPSLTMHL